MICKERMQKKENKRVEQRNKGKFTCKMNE